MGERFSSRVGRFIDEWIQRRLTPAEDRERLEVDLFKQRFYGEINRVEKGKKKEPIPYVPHGVDGPDLLSLMQVNLLFRRDREE